MHRRVIAFEELKNGSFVCRDGMDGPEFGRSESLDGALDTTANWLSMQDFDGEADVLVKPWRATPFSGPALKHNYDKGRNLWKT